MVQFFADNFLKEILIRELNTVKHIAIANKKAHYIYENIRKFKNKKKDSNLTFYEN